MPEGHTIHRAARKHRRMFAGERLRVTSPQGRFTDGAARLDGHLLETVVPYGKHLFYHWDHGEVLHVHLGLFGRFRTFSDEAPEPTDGTRLALSGRPGTLYLAGASTVELIDPDMEDAIRSRLGPDPLHRPVDGRDRFARNLRRRTIPIGAALLRQEVLAGVGNVYRSEVLFLCGIEPSTPARALDDRQVECLWTTIVAQLTAGARSGRIVTVDPAEVGAPHRRALRRHERLYTYKRDGEPCRRCHTEIHTVELDGRSIWWCPSCQG